MMTFESVLQAARELSDADRLRLIDTLWSEAPAEAELQLHPEWEAELERRLAELANGAETIPWETVRAEALARIENARRP